MPSPPVPTPMVSDPRLLEILRQVSDSNISIRAFLERIIEERHTLYDTRFRAAEVAVSAALAAQEKAVAAAFLASKEAITKAEQAQSAYNVVHNDLAHKMELQGKETIPRPEALGLFKAQEDKLHAVQANYENKLEAVRLSFEKDVDTLDKELSDLRLSHSTTTGKSLGANSLWLYLLGGAGLASTILSILSHYTGK